MDDAGSVAARTRAAEEYRLREERFPPEGDQSGGVEVARMQSPETHATVAS
jgi:hypothetical protein